MQIESQNSNVWIESAFFESHQRNNNQSLKRKTKNALNGKFKKKLNIKSNFKKECGNVLFVEKCFPKNSSDLAVSKKKIDEVANWLKLWKQDEYKPKCPILLLTGPTGCGKTTTIKVLALEFNFVIHEWNNPQYTEFDGFVERDESVFHHIKIGQMQQFKRFLLQSGRYHPLIISGSNKRLLLIEELPGLSRNQNFDLSSLLRQYCISCSVPLIFVFDDKERFSNFFPSSLIDELSITHISFKAISSTHMMKALLRITALQEFKGFMFSKSILENIISSSNGDIRAAVNELNFATGRQTSSSVHHKKNYGDKQEKDVCSLRDVSLFLFRALGKLLHAKRNMSVVLEKKLPVGFEKMERYPLLIDPDDICERKPVSASLFLSYLHQSFLFFLDNLYSVEQASSYLSHADVLLSDWKELALMVGIRGILFAKENTTKTSGWQPLHRPQWLDVYKDFNIRSSQVKNTFIHYGLPNEELVITFLPYFQKIKNKEVSVTLSSNNLIKISEDISTFSLFLTKPKITPCLLENEAIYEPPESENFCIVEKDDIPYLNTLPVSRCSCPSEDYDIEDSSDDMTE